MNLAVVESLTSAAQPIFTDGFGERRQATGARGERLEVLRLSSTLSSVGAMDVALRERATRLASFIHDNFTHVRVVEAESSTGALLVVSDHVSGVRLSSLLAAAEKRSLSLDILAVRCLLRQLVHAAAAWHHAMPDIPHGAIGPERIIVTPNGRLVVADCVLGSMLPGVRYTRDRYWAELRVATPALPIFDARTDVMQVGLVGLAIVLGRRLASDVYPTGIALAIERAALRSGLGLLEPLPHPFREWLRRTTQIDSLDAFRTASDAAAALDDAIGTEDAAVERDALHVFLARCLALDVRPPQQNEASDTDNSSLSLDAIDDVASEVDLAPRIEALRAFLARYPIQTQRAPAPEPPPAPPASPAPQALPEQKAAASAPVTQPTPAVAQPAPPVAQPAAPPEQRAAYTPPPASLTKAVDPPLQAIEPESPSILAIEDQETSEVDAHSHRNAAPIRGFWSPRLLIGAIVAVIVAATLIGLYASGLLRFARPEARGTFSISTTPIGIPVIIDNERRGVTPLDIELPAGNHQVELITSSGRRQIPVTIKAGSQMSQFLELSNPTATTPVPALGELLVRTDPASASVTVDGRLVGRSPVSVGDLAPGPHTVVLTHPSGTVTERVLIESGRTASLLVSLGDRPGSSAAGWIALTAPADVQVFEDSRLLGNNRIDRIMVPIGRHDLDIVNDSLGVRQRRTVQVTAGQVTPIKLDWPNGTLALNAVPWAEVFVDGRPVGETPIGSIQVPVGTHEIVFRHPELGESRHTVTVTTSAAAKVGVDLRSK